MSLNNEAPMEANIDLVEMKKFFLFIRKNFILLLVTSTVALATGLYLESKKKNFPKNLFKAKLPIELARTKNYNYLDHHDNLEYLIKENFNVSFSNIKNTQIFELISIAESKSNASQRVNEAFNFILTRHKKLSLNMEILVPTRNIGELKVSRHHQNRRLKQVIRVSKFTFSGFLLGLILCLLFELRKKLAELDI